MVMLAYVVLLLYCVALTYITLYCIMQFSLLWKYKRANRKGGITAPDISDYPIVTVQLPIYNELYVAARLLDNICSLNYPKDKLEIQVLDDSTDETVEITRQKVEQYRQDGFDIQLIHRPDRKGFKAGALQNGMLSARGEFIAIFDADFLPQKDFLLNTIPHFQDPTVGVVQTRWEHLNQNYSLITRLQAFQLNVHFTVEQSGRQAADYLLQFNGTAGVWRASTIADAGGWAADTLTEDLDLSYRAQLRGWQIRYLEDVGSPAELPAEMNGLKSQQFRWMKGGAETARKMLPSIWNASIPLGKKLHASMHLLSSTIFLFVFIVGILSVPVLFVLEPLGIDPSWFSFFLIGLLTIAAVYFVGNSRVDWQDKSAGYAFGRFLLMFPVFLALSMGMSLHNTIAVLEGYMGRKSAFIRTPKFNLKSISDSLMPGNPYLTGRLPVTTIFEGLLAVYFMVAIAMAIWTNDMTFILFHILLAFGYGAICFYSIKHLRLKAG